MDPDRRRRSVRARRRPQQECMPSRNAAADPARSFGASVPHNRRGRASPAHLAHSFGDSRFGNRDSVGRQSRIPAPDALVGAPPPHRANGSLPSRCRPLCASSGNKEGPLAALQAIALPVATRADAIRSNPAKGARPGGRGESIKLLPDILPCRSGPRGPTV